MPTVGAILVLAGSVLIGAGIIAHDLADRGSHFEIGYVLGGVLAIVGIVILIAVALMRGWGAIPVDQKLIVKKYVRSVIEQVNERRTQNEQKKKEGLFED